MKEELPFAFWFVLVMFEDRDESDHREDTANKP
jgi:hypothetical protein